MESLSGILNSGHAYRKDNLVVVPVGATLPPYCVRCGAPATSDRKSTSFSWHASWIYLTLGLGVLVYVIIVLAVREKASIVMPMCEAHQSLRRRLFWVGTILAVGSVPFGIIVEQVLPQVGDWSLLITAVLLFAGLIIVSPVRQFLRPTFIDKGRSEFKGGAESFLQHLSSTP